MEKNCGRSTAMIVQSYSCHKGPSLSSCATSSVFAAVQPNREPQSFCSEDKSCSCGGPCRLSSTCTLSAPSKPSAAWATSCASTPGGPDARYFTAGNVLSEGPAPWSYEIQGVNGPLPRAHSSRRRSNLSPAALAIRKKGRLSFLAWQLTSQALPRSAATPAERPTARPSSQSHRRGLEY